MIQWRPVYVICMREFIKFFREKSRLLGTLARPVLWPRNQAKTFLVLLLLLVFYRAAWGETIDGPANVRSSPKDTVLFSLNNGAQITVIESTGDWRRIRINALFEKNTFIAENRIRNGVVFTDEEGKDLGKTLGEIAVSGKTEKGGWILISLEGYTHAQNIIKQPTRTKPPKRKSTADDIAKEIEQMLSSPAGPATVIDDRVEDLCFKIEKLSVKDRSFAYYQLMLRIANDHKEPGTRMCALKYFERANSDDYDKSLALHKNAIIASLTPLLRDENEEVGLMTARVLLMMGEADAALPVFEDRSKKGRTDLTLIFSLMKGKPWESRGIEIIRTALCTGDVEKRANALLYLVTLQQEKKIPDSIDMLRKQVVNVAEEILAKPKWDTSEQYSDMRALSAVMSAFLWIGDVKLVPLLQRIAQHPDASYLQRQAEQFAISLQLANCLEPDLKRPVRTSGGAYINSSTSSIGYIPFGPTSSMQSFFEYFNLLAREVDIRQASEIAVKDVPFLIVTEGALGSSAFLDAYYEKLKNYARNGGTILLTTQMKGDHYSKLMEGVRAVGYMDKMQPRTIQAAIVMNHPMFSGYPNTSAALFVNGTFKSLPSSVSVLMKDRRTDEPFMISYPLGKGRIIATTAFPFTGFTHEDDPPEEIILFREILSYFDAPLTLPKIRAGQTIKHRLTIMNNDKDKSATKAVIMIYDPDRVLMRHRKKFPLELKPGASRQLEFEYTTCPTAPPGTWHVKYELMSEGYQLLTSELDPDGTNVWLEYLLQAPRYAPDGKFIVQK